MTYVTGTASAEVLIRHGLRHDEVVEALVREIGLSHEEANQACWSAFTEPHRPNRSIGITAG